jgi:hypothetical protein
MAKMGARVEPVLLKFVKSFETHHDALQQDFSISVCRFDFSRDGIFDIACTGGGAVGIGPGHESGVGI